MGYADRKRRAKEINRMDIIDAAERIFFAKGYDNTSMDEVAREAQFSKRTVYVYFSGKEQIYFEIMIRGYRLLIRMMEDGFKKTPPQSALDELHVIFFTFFDFSRHHPEYFRAIMEYETKGAADRPGAEDPSQAECYRLGERMFGYLLHALQRGAAEGTLRGGLGTEQAALILWACTIGIYGTAEKKGEYLKNCHHTDPDEFVAESFRLMIRLIGRNGANRHEDQTDV